MKGFYLYKKNLKISLQNNMRGIFKKIRGNYIKINNYFNNIIFLFKNFINLWIIYYKE